MTTTCSVCNESLPFPARDVAAEGANVLCDHCAIEAEQVRSCAKHNLRWEPSEEFPTCPVCREEARKELTKDAEKNGFY